MSKTLLVIAQFDSAWAKSLRASLQPLGLVDFSSAAEAMLRIESRGYDVVIIDAEAVDGFARVATRIAGAAPQLPIVIVSASPSWEHAREAFLAGAHDYIGKSLDQKPLVGAVREVLRRSEG